MGSRGMARASLRPAAAGLMACCAAALHMQDLGLAGLAPLTHSAALAPWHGDFVLMCSGRRGPVLAFSERECERTLLAKTRSAHLRRRVEGRARGNGGAE